MAVMVRWCDDDEDEDADVAVGDSVGDCVVSDGRPSEWATDVCASPVTG